MKKMVLVVSLLLLFAAFGGTTAFAAEGDTSSEGEIVYVLDSCDDATNFSTSTIIAITSRGRAAFIRTMRRDV